MGVTVAVMRAACNTSNGTQDFTTPDMGGLTPKAAMFILSGGITDGAAADGLHGCIGFTTGASNSMYLAFQSDHAVTTTDTVHDVANDECVITILVGAEEARGAFSAFISDGVRINWETAPASAHLMTVVLFGGTDLSAHANFVDLLNTVDSAIDVTDPGFEPDILITAQARSTVGGSVATHGVLGLGVVHNDGASTITQRCLYFISRDNRADGQPALMLREDAGSIGGTLGAAEDYYVDFKLAGRCVRECYPASTSLLCNVGP